MSAYWNRLSLGSRAILVLVPVLLVVGAVLTVAAALLLGPLLDFINANLPLGRFVLAATALIVITIPIAFLIIYMELKVIAAINLRVGPDRVGPFGALMSVVHGLKVLSKEDFTPLGVDVPIFTLAPIVVFASIPLTLLVIPFAPGLYGQDFNLALLYFFAIGGMSVVGLMMAGWASFNKYSLLGALRAAAQAISYELPLTLSVVGIIILAGTMSLNSIVHQQAGSLFDWNIWKQPLGFIIFFIAATAEANRTPLDMTEADQELVAGFATEYSGMRFGFFFFAEYVNVFVVSALSAVLFFGGWNAPFDWPFPVTVSLDPGGLGLGLIFLIALAPVVGTIILGLPFWLLSSRISTLRALVTGFVLFNLLIVAAFFGWAFVSAAWVSGLVWMMLKTFVFVFIFVQMRGTLPRVRVDQLMSFAWKWLLPASLLNIFVTATAVSILANR
ncbi:MAG: NADH-quinone oxidoreductase subunit H [Candidatus Limnocylindrales bacterium]|nr:NADH-quinone oxidoreductase subunit H [Candidatus Limnocylindrales bacterium]